MTSNNDSIYWPCAEQLVEIGNAGLALADVIWRTVKTTSLETPARHFIFHSCDDSSLAVQRPLLNFNAVIHGRSTEYHRTEIRRLRETGLNLDLSEWLVALPGDRECPHVQRLIDSRPAPLYWFETLVFGWPYDSQVHASYVELCRLCWMLMYYFEYEPFFAVNEWTYLEEATFPFDQVRSLAKSMWVRSRLNERPEPVIRTGVISESATGEMPYEWLQSLRYHSEQLLICVKVPIESEEPNGNAPPKDESCESNQTPNKPADGTADKSLLGETPPLDQFSMGDLCEITDLSNDTIRRHGKSAVGRWPKRGEKTFSFTKEEAIQIIRAIEQKCHDANAKKGCRNWLDSNVR